MAQNDQKKFCFFLSRNFFWNFESQYLKKYDLYKIANTNI